MATQTGSISFEAVGGFSSYASGQFTTTEDVAQMAQPNLTPFFSMAKTDVYDASTNPRGYWKRVITNSQFTTYDMQVEHDGSGGWAHFAGNVTSGNPFVRFEPMPIVTIKPSTKYTFVVDVDTVDAASTITRMTLMLFSGSAQSDCIDPFSTTGDQAVLGKTGTYYVSGTTKANISNVTGLCRSYLQVYGTGTFDVYLRVSLYEGEYEGPYKPYVDQSLITRVSTAETSIEQNAENITLRAQEIERSMTFVPLKHDREDVWFWYSLPATQWTLLDDGWAHYEYTNAGTSEVSTYIAPKSWGQVIPGEEYTFLIEIKNYSGFSGTGQFMYMQEMAGAQFWGTQVVKANGNVKSTRISYDDIVDGAFTKRFVKLADVAHIGDGTAYDNMCFRYRMYIKPNTTLSIDVRISVYPGDYAGPYNEYLTAASGAQLKVANDEIDLRVEKSGVIAAINASTEAEGGSAVKISADKVQIDGTTTFTSGTTLADYVEGKAQDAADSVVVGGRNLLRRTGTPFDYAINTTNYGTHHLYSTGSTDTAYDGPTLEELGFAVGDEVTFTFDWETSQNGSAAIRYGNFRVEYYGVTSSGTNGYITAMAGGVVTMSESNASGRFSRTATLTAATIKTQRMVLRIDNSALVFTVSNAKLEKGNKATDWTPAPEDVTSRTQRIYYRTSSSTAPTSQYMPTAWVTETGDKWAANSTTVANWTAKATKLTNGTTKYPYLFTCEQRQMGDGTLAYTTVLLDETTTVIDGGSIITNSIDANKLTVYDATIGKIKADAIDVSAIKIGDLDGASTVVSNAANGKSAYDRHTAYRGTCSTAAGTAAKVVTCTGFALATGATVEVYCSTANTANVPTLNVNSTGAKPIWINGAVASASNPCKWLVGDTVTFTYDGTRFRASLPVEGYVTEGTGGGLMVHRKSDATTGVKITDSVEILQNGTSVAEYGATARIGEATKAHIEQTSNQLSFFASDGVTNAITMKTTANAANGVVTFPGGAGIISANDGSTLEDDSYISLDSSMSGYANVTIAAHSSAEETWILVRPDRVILQHIASGGDIEGAPLSVGELSLATPLADTYIGSVSASKLTGTIADANLPIKDSAGTAGTDDATSGATLAVPYITTDAYGRVIAKGTHTHTIGSLAASAVTSGTFNAARIPNLNASKITAGTLDSARLPTVPVDKGGTGQTGVEKTTDIAAAMSAASGVTISAAQVATWGKVMQVLITAKATAAKSGTWTVGTMTAGHRPELVTFGTSNLAAIEQCRMGTDGAVSVAGTLAANASVSLTFTYLLA